MAKVVIYARVSTQGQDYERQLAELRVAEPIVLPSSSTIGKISVLLSFFIVIWLFCYCKDSDKRARLAKLALIFHSECSLYSRDLLLLALSILIVKLTTPPYRGPNGTNFARTSFDQPLSALSIMFLKLTTLANRNPCGTTFCGAARDLLRLALSILIVKLTTPSYRGPNGTSFTRPTFDQPLSALSIIVEIDNTCQPQPAGRDSSTHPATYCCKYCRFYNKKRGIFLL